MNNHDIKKGQPAEVTPTSYTVEKSSNADSRSLAGDGATFNDSDDSDTNPPAVAAFDAAHGDRVTASPTVAAVKPLPAMLDHEQVELRIEMALAACAGLSTEILGLVKAGRIAELLDQRSELLAAVEKFLAFGKSGGDTGWHSPDAQSFFYEMMCAAGKAR